MKPRKQKKPISNQECTSTIALPTLEQCYAKTRVLENGTAALGRNVFEHCQIVGAVAKYLLKQIPPCLKELFPKYSENIALVHDVGKVCPTFQKKIYNAAHVDCSEIPVLRNVDSSLEKQWGGHATVSQSTLSGCQVGVQVAEIAGQHHGRSHAEKPHNYSAFGGEDWHNLRRELLCLLLQKPPEDSLNWPQIDSWEHARLLAGLTIVADWIGSGYCFDDPAQGWESLISKAVHKAGFIPLSINKNLTFENIFSFAPLETQQKFYEQIDTPGVYVLEAPMGMGKTEAALYAAYNMLANGLSTGIYFALPTRITSNRIYSRFNAFLAKILPTNTPHHAHLLHGKAWLAPFISQEMGMEAAPSGAWFSGKKTILAPFAVGTVDQALMAAMHVRHGAVRAFGLAGKTVILDEVHSYDVYTGTILDSLVRILRCYNCTVIILSATLTTQRRARLIGGQSTLTNYPLISVSKTAKVNQEIPCTSPKSHPVDLWHCHDDANAIEEALLRAEQGQQVLWIENTVKTAQNIYKLLSARANSMPIELGLIHSRFTVTDRSNHENKWTNLYGKNSTDRFICGRILVGTQVLEQSLDIDADFLVTRFCPTDMLLQRLGRLWRHEQARPLEARCEAWLLHPTLKQVLEQPKQIWGAIAYVYAPYVLYRSLMEWGHLLTVNLPKDIRPLLEATYVERSEDNPDIILLLQELNNEKSKYEGLALRGLSNSGSVQDDNNVSTRVSENQQSDVDVLLLRFFKKCKGETTIMLADGTQLSLHAHAQQTWQTRQEIAAKLSLNIVRVPVNDAPAPLNMSELNWLSPWLYCGNKYDKTAHLRLAIISGHDHLQDINNRTTSKQLMYRKDFGYIAY